ncbi:MAG: AzlC family ABC transporter permease [Rhodospirillales bacterium]|jgi:predicted branched-subunit amino acid permease|nr:AzlC family ABC transporter permease [Rhodospirillales bacterium]
MVEKSQNAEHPEDTERSPSEVRKHGARDAFGIPALVLFASMMGFGSLARESGINVWHAIMTTIGIWGLPGQIVMVEMVAVGAPVVAVAMGVAAANARFLPMTLAITPYLSDWKTTWPRRMLFAQFVTLTPWAAALQRFPSMKQSERIPYYAGFSIVCLIAAVLGTYMGHVLAGILPRPLTLSLMFLSPAFFAMVFAGVRQRAGVIALFSGAIIGPYLHGLSVNWGIPATGILAGSFAFGVDFLLRRYAQGRAS